MAEKTQLTQEFLDCYSWLPTCCLRDDGPALLARVEECVAFIGSENDGPSGAAVVRLDGGEWAAFEEWQDYSGHGCQCGAVAAGPFKTKREAELMGLDESGRRVLGIED